MKPENTHKSTRTRVQFIGLYIVSIILIVVVFAAFSNKVVPNQQARNTVLPLSEKGEDKILTAYELLHNRLREMHFLYQNLNDNSGSSQGASGDDAMKKLADAEEALKNSLDSLEQQKALYKEEKDQNRFTALLANYNQALENHRSVTNIYSTLSNNKDTGATAQNEKLLQLQSDLDKKDSRIAALERQLRSTPVSTGNTSSDQDKDLQVRNERLRSFVVTLQDRNATLMSLNLKLKKDNEFLLLQQNSSRGSGSRGNE